MNEFQENEQFKIQEKRRSEREKKKREMEEKKKESGGKIKTKKPNIIEPEETCIVDKLMDEIRAGFPLRKLSISKPSSPGHGMTLETRRASQDRARRSIRRASLLAKTLSKLNEYN